MSDFEPAIEAQLMGATVVMAVLVEVQFTSGPMYLWTGLGTRAFGGRDWQGVGSILTISEITRLQNGQADPFEVEIVASDDIIRLGLVEFADEAQDRELSVYLQFMNYEADTALGAPWKIRDGIMRGATLTVDAETMKLTVACDTTASLRNRPAYGMLTDRDQKSRYPEDRGLEFVHAIDGREILWPVF